jgi:hypothetical protein
MCVRVCEQVCVCMGLKYKQIQIRSTDCMVTALPILHVDRVVARNYFATTQSKKNKKNIKI